jgi:ketosteroid isomerase-like protein
MDHRTSALAEAVRRFGEAWASGDAAALDTLLSPTYTHTDVFGKLSDRAAWLAYASRRSDRTTRIAFRDIQIRVTGDVGIVTGINDIRHAADNKDRTLAFTQAWVWQQGRWLREAFQATSIAETTAS